MDSNLLQSVLNHQANSPQVKLNKRSFINQKKKYSIATGQGPVLQSKTRKRCSISSEVAIPKLKELQEQFMVMKSAQDLTIKEEEIEVDLPLELSLDKSPIVQKQDINVAEPEIGLHLKERQQLQVTNKRRISRTKSRIEKHSISNLKPNNKKSIFCCSGLCSLFSFLFFRKFETLFNKVGRLTENDLYMLPNDSKVRSLVENFDLIQVHNGIALGKNLLRLVSKEISIAITMKIFEQAIGVIIPFLTAIYIRELNSNSVNTLELVSILIFTPFLILVSSLLREHSANYVSRIKSTIGQCLRGIFFSHLVTSNYSFLQNVNGSFIAKMTIFEFDAIESFIGNIPNFASFPFTFVLAVTLIVLEVGTSSLVMLIAFLAASGVLLYLDRRMLKANLAYKKCGSKRTQLLTEMLSDIKSIKLNSWELYFTEKLKKVRKEEINLLNSLSRERAISNCIFFLIPLICATFIIGNKRLLGNEHLDVTVSLAIVTVLNSLQRPLKILASLLDSYLDFKIGHKSLDNFFKRIDQKPSQDKVQKSWIEVGEVKMFDCTGAIIDDLKMHELMDRIFHLRKKNEKRAVESTCLFCCRAKHQHLHKGHPDLKHLKIAQKKSLFKRRSHVDHPLKQISNVDKDDPEHKAELDMVHTRINIKKNYERIFTKDKNHLFDKNITNLMQIVGGTSFSKRINKKGHLMLHMDVSISANPGEAVCLMGKDDSGCEGVLLTIQAETYIEQGTCEISGTTSYFDIAKEFFLEGSTLRDNITLEQKYVKSRYDQVLHVCGLNIMKFRGQDMIEVLEDGKNFSTWERKKIMLARFLYSERDIYLINHYFDELVDHRASERYTKIVKEFLKDKTVLFISRREEFVSKADKIFVFDSGSVVDEGTFSELKKSKKHYFNTILIKKDRVMLNSKSTIMLQQLSTCLAPDLAIQTKQGISDLLSKSTGQTTSLIGGMLEAIVKRFMHKEEGKISATDDIILKKGLSSLLWEYLGVLGCRRVLCIGIVFLFSVSVGLGADIWLGFWSARIIELESFWEYLGIYFGVSIVAGIGVVARDLITHGMLRNNSDSLHFSMIEKFLNTSMGWFIKNPSSKVLYRLTRDQRVIDDKLNIQIQESFDSFITMFAGLLILNALYFGIMIVYTLFLGIFIYFTLRRYSRVVEYFSQAAANKKAEVQAMYLKAMNDAIHYRELSMIPKLSERFFNLSDKFQTFATHMNNFSQRWLGMRILLIRITTMILALAIPWILHTYSGGMYLQKKWELALAITWSIKLLESIGSWMQDYTNTLHMIISVGRILEYTQHTDVEWDEKKSFEVLKMPNKQIISQDAPFAIEAKNVSLKFGQHSIINNLTLRVDRVCRVAVLGGSGSGKHSIMNLFFGIYQKTGGYLSLFGSKIENLRPLDLRRIAYYVASKPSLYALSVTENIDPFGEVTVNELIKVLAFLGFFELVKHTTESLRRMNEWGKIQQDPDRILQLIINLSDYLMKFKCNKFENYCRKKMRINNKESPKIIGDKKIHASEKGRMNLFYQAIFSELLMKSNIKDTKREDSTLNKPLSPLILSKHQKIKASLRVNSSKGPKKKAQGRRSSLLSLKLAGHLSRLDDFSLESQSAPSSPTEEYETIKKFLSMQVANQGNNIPVNMRKIISLAKAIVDSPQVIFIDENALDLGYDAAWEHTFKKISYCFEDRLIIGLLNSTCRIVEFDQVILVENGAVVEQGNVLELLKNKESKVAQKMLKETPDIYHKYRQDHFTEMLDVSIESETEIANDPIPIQLGSVFNESSLLIGSMNCFPDIIKPSLSCNKNDKAINDEIQLGFPNRQSLLKAPPQSKNDITEDIWSSD